LNKIEIGGHDAAMISFGNGHILQKPDCVTDDGYMNIPPGQFECSSRNNFSKSMV
jgi:hypothetical protein